MRTLHKARHARFGARKQYAGATTHAWQVTRSAPRPAHRQPPPGCDRAGFALSVFGNQRAPSLADRRDVHMHGAP